MNRLTAAARCGTGSFAELLAGTFRIAKYSPDHRNRVRYLQIAPVSRGDVAQYRALRREPDELVGRIDGEYADFDRTPLRYLTRSVGRATLAGFYRLAHVGRVTPLRDGINLVAKEYVAAQEADDPGVLVLSRFACAAQELDGAILVNPQSSIRMLYGFGDGCSTSSEKGSWQKKPA